MDRNRNRDLLLGARFGDIGRIDEALKGGADIDCQDDQGYTPLMIAAGAGRVDVVEHLVERGALIDYQNNDGRTALMSAATCGKHDVVACLLSHEAEKGLQDCSGETALDKAKSWRKTGVIGLLEEKCSDEAPQTETSLPDLAAVAEAPEGCTPSGPPAQVEPQESPSAGDSFTGPVYIPLPGKSGDVQGALIIHPKDFGLKLPSLRETMISRDSDETALRLGSTLSAIPALGTYLQAGNMVQVVGSPQVVGGLADGTYTLIRDGENFLGTVKNAATGRFAGQLRFRDVSRFAVAAPMLLWTAANIVFGTIHLQRIDEKLADLQEAVSRLEARLQRERLAKAMVACEILEEVTRKYQCLGYFDEDMLRRLDDAEFTIRVINKESELMLSRFENLAARAMKEHGHDGAKTSIRLLGKEGQDALEDIHLMTHLFTAEVRADRLHVVHEMSACPEYLEERMERIHARINHHAEQLEKVGVFRELSDHARECVNEMGWFRRKVWNRGLAGEVHAVAEDINSRVKDMEPALATGNQEPIYLVWSESGRIWSRRLERDELSAENPIVHPTGSM